MAEINKAYIDASGDQANSGTKAVVVACYAAEPETWAHLEPRWEKALRGDGRRPSLDRFNSADLDRLVFRGLDGWDAKSASSLILNLAQVIRGCGLVKRGFGCGVKHCDFEVVNKQFQMLEKVGGAYVWALLGLHRLLRSTIAGYTRQSVSNYELLTDGGDSGWSDYKRFESTDPLEARIRAVPNETFDSDGSRVGFVRPFEAADLLAYEARRGFVEWRNQVPPRDAGLHVEGTKPRVGWEDAGTLTEHCIRMDIPRRI